MAGEGRYSLEESTADEEKAQELPTKLFGAGDFEYSLWEPVTKDDTLNTTKNKSLKINWE